MGVVTMYCTSSQTKEFSAKTFDQAKITAKRLQAEWLQSNTVWTPSAVSGRGGYNETGSYTTNIGAGQVIWRSPIEATTTRQEYLDAEAEANLTCYLSASKVTPQVLVVMKAHINSQTVGFFYLSEKYDGDMWSFFGQENRKLTSKQEVEFTRLFEELASLGCFCVDLKPSNSVYKVMPDGSIDFKLIDWGVDFCEIRMDKKVKENKELFAVVMMILYSVAAEELRFLTNFSRLPLFHSTIRRYMMKPGMLNQVVKLIMATSGMPVPSDSVVYQIRRHLHHYYAHGRPSSMLSETMSKKQVENFIHLLYNNTQEVDRLYFGRTRKS